MGKLFACLALAGCLGTAGLAGARGVAGRMCDKACGTGAAVCAYVDADGDGFCDNCGQERGEGRGACDGAGCGVRSRAGHCGR